MPKLRVLLASSPNSQTVGQNITRLAVAAVVVIYLSELFSVENAFSD